MIETLTGLGGLGLQSTYDTYEDNPLEDFLVPALEQSIRYDRAVGYFSGAIITVLAEAFTDFAERGGRMRLVCSPFLTPADASALEAMTAETFLKDLNDSINSLEGDGLLREPLDLMASLIRSGCLSIKLAVPFNPSVGIFHQKVGIFEDESGDKVAFLGSNNESLAGWLDMRNSESFSVFQSWRDRNDHDRVADIERRFNRFWSDSYDGFDITDFHESLQFVQRRADDDVPLEELKGGVRDWYQRRQLAKKAGPSGLYPYQQEVIDDWVDNEYEGMVCFATGAGKTRTAIAAIDLWREQSEKHVVIVLVPTTRLQKQWLREIRKFSSTKNTDIVLVGGDAPAERWHKALTDVTDYRRHLDDGIVIAVNRSASAESFYERVSWGRHILLVADEVHNLGAPSFKDLLERMECGAVLALSATPQRYNDDETQYVREKFGPDLHPIVDIPYAQDLGVLVPYRYRFKTVTLNEDEEQKYKDLSRSIGRIAATDGADSDSLQVLRAQRANVLKNAASKVGAAADLLMREYRPGQSWLVFCNDTAQLNELKSRIRGLQPLDFHGGSEGDQDATLRLFEREGGILLSIHMMDEGVDIPSIDHCLLIASSQSTRQFIQRRGRVLRADRVNPKGSAEIWDMLVVDQDGKAFVEAEVTRAMEFGSMAMNRATVVEDLRRLSRSSETYSSVGGLA
jgi:superfamily II DNA or RNA helicase